MPHGRQAIHDRIVQIGFRKTETRQSRLVREGVDQLSSEIGSRCALTTGAGSALVAKNVNGGHRIGGSHAVLGQSIQETGRVRSP